VLVVAKSDAAHRALAEQFRDRASSASTTRWCAASAQEAGRVDRPIGRHPRERKRMSVHARWRARRRPRGVLARFPASEHAWLEVKPETGRTHQIRVHLASLGLPLAGDPVYGRGRASALDPGRPALHAAVLGFQHPRSGERLRFEAPLPADLVELLAALARREAER
jgi:23S rRNA pseudouridine1911/1915/1917 synthase